MYCRNFGCTIIDGDAKKPGRVLTGYTSNSVGHELEVEEGKFAMLTPHIVNKQSGEVTPATYQVKPTDFKGRRLLFTRRTDGKYRLKGSRKVELSIGTVEVNQIFA